MTQPEINYAALEALEKAATPGPWHSDYDDVRRGEAFIIQEARNPYDADFIAALRNAAPALIAAAKERDELRRQLWNMTQLATERHAERDEARADIARMKAAMEEVRPLLDDIVEMRLGHTGCWERAVNARHAIDKALKGTSP